MIAQRRLVVFKFIASVKLDLHAVRRFMLQINGDRLTMDQRSNSINKQLEGEIEKHNQSDPKNAVVIDCPALHLLRQFTLFECIKNSLDAKATQMIISVCLHDNKVLVTICDDGPRKSDSVTSLGKYSYEEALRVPSEKKMLPDSSGGAGKALAMSAQYLTLFADSGKLLVGNRAGSKNGYVVFFSSENQLKKMPWSYYFSAFDEFYSGRQSVSSPLAPAALGEEKTQQDFCAIEKKLVENVTEIARRNQEGVSYFMLFSPTTRGLPDTKKPRHLQGALESLSLPLP